MFICCSTFIVATCICQIRYIRTNHQISICITDRGNEKQLPKSVLGSSHFISHERKEREKNHLASLNLSFGVPTEIEKKNVGKAVRKQGCSIHEDQREGKY